MSDEKQFSSELPPQYDPDTVEPRWAEFWVKENLYRAVPDGNKKETFSIVIPPPNVTGMLHMGHALNATLQDILVRFARMRGDDVIWVLGTDHAGIATQNVVERKLKAEGKARADLGREVFVDRVWQWRRESGGQIVSQLKRLGASCDFTRERFTMDEGLSLAVREAFARLYEAGLIYRGEHLINWCPRCETALSDLEVEYAEEAGSLWPLDYPVVGTETRIVVATTRPETYLGDTAVAVHPDDPRYRSLIGKAVSLPLLNRVIPIIADDAVDPKFGSGAVKVTPAHDPNDFEMGNRHALPRISVMDKSGKMNAEAGPYAGLDRYEARKRIVADLIAAGFLNEAEIKAHRHSVGHCYRCHTVVEPRLSLQWFVKTAPLAKTAKDAVERGETRFVPEHWEKIYFQWLDNIRDWCISRQIWWGHRIPAWYCASDHVTVSRETPKQCATCGDVALSQDPDVLDTWFSSALWPFSTLGWPDPKAMAEGLLERFYPTSVLVTAHDIIFFWVARMMMMGLYLMKEVPFRHVYIHALVRDAEGQKMSKSKGNVVDPLSIMGKYGTDAFRFTLAALAAQGRDIRLDESRIAGYRNFINKIWNASRFILPYLSLCEGGWQKVWAEARDQSEFAPHYWIRSRLGEVIKNVTAHVEAYAFNEAALALYHFFWDDFCSWYIEWIKPLLNGSDRKEAAIAAATAAAVLNSALKVLHPFIPFVTEEIGSRLDPSVKTLSLEALPQADEFFKSDRRMVEKLGEADRIVEVTERIRNLRGENRIPPSVKLSVYLIGQGAEKIAPYEAILKRMAALEALNCQESGKIPEKSAIAIGPDGLAIAVPMAGLIDVDTELARLEKDGEKLIKELDRVRARLENPDFALHAPEDVVRELKDNCKRLETELLAQVAMRERLLSYR